MLPRDTIARQRGGDQFGKPHDSAPLAEVTVTAEMPKHIRDMQDASYMGIYDAHYGFWNSEYTQGGFFLLSNIIGAGETAIAIEGAIDLGKAAWSGGKALLASGTKGGSSVLLNTSRQLQAKFKHAGDFGVLGNYSKANAGKFSSAINQHINSAGVQTINGTYRGQSVIHYLNPNTGLNVISNPAGQFISGWKLNPAQLQNVLKHGGL